MFILLPVSAQVVSHLHGPQQCGIHLYFQVLIMETISDDQTFQDCILQQTVMHQKEILKHVWSIPAHG